MIAALKNIFGLMILKNFNTIRIPQILDNKHLIFDAKKIGTNFVDYINFDYLMDYY